MNKTSYTIAASMVVAALMPFATYLAAQEPRDPQPKDAVTAVISAFDRYPVVALGMSHRSLNEHDFSLAVIRDPRFARKVRNVVIEAEELDRRRRLVSGGSIPVAPAPIPRP